MKRIKVAILFGTEPDFDQYAFKYFILYVNKIQSFYEFCFPDVSEFPFETGVVDFKTSHSKIETLIGDSKIVADHYIAIITNRFDNNYFFNSRYKTSIITTHIWDKHFSPPSLFEYLLHCIYSCLLYSKRLPAGIKMSEEKLKIEIDSHDDTRGCIADFTRHKHDDRIDITLGYICEEHIEQILTFYGDDYLKQFQFVIDRKWISNINEKDSVAYNLKHIFKFDINKDSGFNKNWVEKTKEKLSEIPGTAISEVVKILITAILAFLLIKLGLSKQ